MSKDIHKQDYTRPDTYFDGSGKNLGDKYFQRVPPAMPAGLVGEYLPPLDDEEVEIIMIGMYSTLGDVISVRARKGNDCITYHVVDEYETEFDFEPQKSDLPLTVTEAKKLLDSIRIEHIPLFRSYWEDPDYDNSFFYLQSEFYLNVEDWIDELFEEYVQNIDS